MRTLPRNQLIHGLSLAEPRHAFIRTVERMAYGRRVWEVFRDFCEMAACAYTNVAPHVLNEKRERRYRELAATYDADQLQAMAFLNSCVVMEMERKGFDDVLGGIFMEMDLGSQWHGQFFTPYCLSELMARMTLDEKAREMDIIRWHEPACGAGAMMIAVAESLLALKLNPQQILHTEAIDIDPLCVHMAVIQMSVLGLPAVVHHANTLTLERWDKWVTPAHVLGRWEYKLKRADARVLDLQGTAQGNAAVIGESMSIDTNKQTDTTSNEVEQLALF